MEVVKIKEREVAVGLWWQDIDPGETLKTKNKEILSEFPEYNCYAYKKQGSPQVGFGVYADTFIPYISLAVAFNESVGKDSFLGWFRIDKDRIWVVASADGVILADLGDFVGSESEAEEVYQNLNSMDDPPWGDNVYYYDDIEDSLEYLSGVVERATKNAKLHSTKTQINKKLVYGIIFFCSLSLSLFFGYQKYNEYQKEQEMLRMMEAKRAMLEKEQQEDPWISAPMPGSVLNICEQRYDQLPEYYYGWKLDSVSCGFDFMKIKRIREYATFHFLLEDYVFNLESPNMIVKNLSVDMRTKKREKVQLFNLDLVSSRIFEVARLLEATGVRVTVNKNNQPSSTDAPVSKYREGNFEITGDTSWIFSTTGFLDKIPGLILESVDVSGSETTIKGVFYAKNN